MAASPNLAAPSLGSGARFRKLSSTLAARGASDPDALAAWIGRKKLGGARMAGLSARGHANPGEQIAFGNGYIQGRYANPDLGIYLSETAKDDQGLTLTCPECGHVAAAGDFGASGASLGKQPGDLQTPAPSTGAVRDGAAVTVRGGNAAHALASSTRRALELAAGTMARRPVQGPADVLVARAADGTAVLRHRHGGAQIASLRKTDGGQWVATVNGRDLTPRDHQRTALMEAVGTWNGAVTGALRRTEAPLQPPPQQTELMAEYGIPAIRALANTAAGAGDGPRMTTAGGDDDDSADENGLNAKGQAIYARLIKKGLSPKQAAAFARRAQNTAPGQFGKVSA